MNTAEERLQEVLAAFDFGAPVVGALRYGQGHINDTFVVHTQPEDCCCRRFILQRMSAAAFKHPDELMENIIGVTGYLGREIGKHGGDRDREAMRVLRPRSGGPFYTDSEGGAWRVYPFVERTICYQSAETPELFAASGRAFGRFQRLLADFPADRLTETIPHFHDTPARFATFQKAVEEDCKGRASQVEAEIRFIREREKEMGLALSLQKTGELPLRVSHNDTKLNNIMIDDATGQALCIIDLDTIMPGFSIFDYGDSIRFGANTAEEDERDLSKVSLSLPLFEVYTKGFLEGSEGRLTETEIELLPYGAKMMTLECGMRFLTDHLMGDVYFHISREGHNLDRCRTQLALVADMEKKWTDMERIVKQYQG